MEKIELVMVVEGRCGSGGEDDRDGGRLKVVFLSRIREKWSEGAYIINLENIKLGNLQVGGYGKGLGVLNPSPKFYGVKDWPKFRNRVLMGLKMFNNL